VVSRSKRYDFADARNCWREVQRRGRTWNICSFGLRSSGPRFSRTKPLRGAWVPRSCRPGTACGVSVLDRWAPLRNVI